MSAINYASSAASKEARLLLLRDFDSKKLQTPMDAWETFLGKLSIAVADCDAQNAAQILDRQLLFALAKEQQTITLTVDVAKMILGHLFRAPALGHRPPTSLLKKIWQEMSLDLARQLKKDLIAAGKSTIDAEYDAAKFLSDRHPSWNRETARRRLQDRPGIKSDT